MPCDCCERGEMEPCGYEPVYFDQWTNGGLEYDAACDGYIPGDPGDYMVDRCKVRLGIHWLFNEVKTE
jgi:hypothetical protein